MAAPIATAATAATADADPAGLAAFPVAERAPLGALIPEAASASPLPLDAPDLDASDLDEHGHDPAAYRWVPVLRKRRADGWSPEKQRGFIEALADTGLVEDSARDVGMSPASCYRLRRAPGAESFAAAWDAAIHQASRKLVDLAFDRAINGSNEPVFDKDGQRVGRRMRTNDRLLMFLLRAHLPARYGHAGPEPRGPGGAGPPYEPPLADMIATLEPAAPPDPHLLMSPDERETALLCADILDGELPHWHRDPPVVTAQTESPLGEAFEAALEAAKREASGLPPKPKEGGYDAF